MEKITLHLSKPRLELLSVPLIEGLSQLSSIFNVEVFMDAEQNNIIAIH